MKFICYLVARGQLVIFPALFVFLLLASSIFIVVIFLLTAGWFNCIVFLEREFSAVGVGGLKEA